MCGVTEVIISLRIELISGILCIFGIDGCEKWPLCNEDDDDDGWCPILLLLLLPPCLPLGIIEVAGGGSRFDEEDDDEDDCGGGPLGGAMPLLDRISFLTG